MADSCLPSANFASPRNAPAWNVARPNCIVSRSASEKFFPNEAGFVDSSEGW